MGSGVASQMYQGARFMGLLRGAGQPPAGRTRRLTKERVMRVLVSGDGGYIGAVLVPFFQRAGHEVDGLDLGLYEGCDLGPAQPGANSPGRLDMREVTAAQLTGYDAVVCLAALSNDPLGDLNPAATYSVNLDGTMRLAPPPTQAGAARGPFSSLARTS